MKQSKQVLVKRTTKKEEGRDFVGCHTQNLHWFTCTRCSPVFQKIQMFKYRNQMLYKWS